VATVVLFRKPDAVARDEVGGGGIGGRDAGGDDRFAGGEAGGDGLVEVEELREEIVLGGKPVGVEHGRIEGRMSVLERVLARPRPARPAGEAVPRLMER
jgi:hypothetical protein